MKNIKAFTIIELMVILSITILMTIAVFSNYGKNNDTFALERASQKLAQDLRRTQEIAMSGSEGATASVGIYFDKTSANKKKYIMYTTTNANMYRDAGDTDKETINIENGIEICNVLDNGAAPALNANSLSVCFQPPEPLTYIDSNYAGHEASIVLCASSDNTKTRTIMVNNVGRIQVTNP
jgi:type II secretory pathway pseudopilin PulG